MIIMKNDINVQYHMLYYILSMLTPSHKLQFYLVSYILPKMYYNVDDRLVAIAVVNMIWQIWHERWKYTKSSGS